MRFASRSLAPCTQNYIIIWWSRLHNPENARGQLQSSLRSLSLFPLSRTSCSVVSTDLFFSFFFPQSFGRPVRADCIYVAFAGTCGQWMYPTAPWPVTARTLSFAASGSLFILFFAGLFPLHLVIGSSGCLTYELVIAFRFLFCVSRVAGGLLRQVVFFFSVPLHPMLCSSYCLR